MGLYLLFSVLLAVSALLSLHLAVYALLRRTFSGALSFALFMGGEFVWSAGYLFELQSTTLEGRIFWDNVQCLGFDALAAGGLLFALEYSERTGLIRRYGRLLAVLPLISLAIIWGGRFPDLLRVNPAFDPDATLPLLTYDFGPWFRFIFVYDIVLLIIAVILLLDTRRHGAERWQCQGLPATLAIGAPLLGMLMTGAILVPLPGMQRLDVTPLAFAVANPFWIWALFKGRLLDITPIARDLLFTHMADAVLVINAQQRITDANPAACRVFACHDPLIGATLAAVAAPIASRLHAMPDDQPAWIDITLEQAETRIFAISCTPLRAMQHHTSGRLLLLRDVTAQRREEEFVRRQQALFQSVLDNAPIFVSVMDHHSGRYILVNRSLAEMLGTQPYTMVGQSPARYFPPELANSWLAQDRRIAAQGRPYQAEEDFESSRGNRSILTTKFPLFDGAGQVYAIGAVFIDITARKAAEQSLANSAARLRALVGVLPDLMFFFTADGYFTDYQAPHENNLLRRPAEFLGRHVSEVLPGELASATLRMIRETLHTGAMQVLEYSLPINDHERFFEARYVRIGDTEVLSFVRDTTLQRRAALELVHAKEAAEAADRAKTEFLATISHELRTPLNAVIGLTDLLLVGGLPEEHYAHALQIRSSSRLLLTLINDLLDLSKIEVRQLEIAMQSFEPRVFLAETLQMIAPEAEKKGLALHLEVRHMFPILLGDTQRLRQVLLNLLANAVKFTEHGAVVLRANGNDREADRYELRIEVQDTGIGIDPAFHKRIFEPFVQVDSSMTRRYGGTGLGLAISQRLINLMGGSLTLHSTPGSGATFMLMLDLARVADQTPSADAALPPDEQSTLPPLQVLVAEDHPINQLVVRRLIEHMGCQVTVAADGRAVLDLLADHRFDVILMDIQMPDMNGEETTRRIRAMQSRIQQPFIVALTAHARLHDREQYLSAGMDDYLSKPVDIQQLRRILEQAAAARLR
jgi:PAS domain S-box-containing protein